MITEEELRREIDRGNAYQNLVKLMMRAVFRAGHHSLSAEFVRMRNIIDEEYGEYGISSRNKHTTTTGERT